MSEKQCDSCLEYLKEGSESEDGFWYCDKCTEPIECQGEDCYHEFTISDFARIDDEYNPSENLCPDCSEKRS